MDRILTMTNKEILEKFEVLKDQTLKSIGADHEEYDRFIKKFFDELGENANQAVVSAMLLAYTRGFLDCFLLAEAMAKGDKDGKKKD